MQSDPKPSMWESLLPLRYENFELEQADVEVYRNLTLCFIKNIERENCEFLKTKTIGEIPGTEDQAESDQWHHQRRIRITASTCKTEVTLGENLSEHDSFHQHFSFINKKLWFPSNYTSVYMQYGIDHEKTALKEYGEKRNASASPDGLLIDDGKIQGMLEVKCLKMLKLHSVLFCAYL